MVNYEKKEILPGALTDGVGVWGVFLVGKISAG